MVPDSLSGDEIHEGGLSSVPSAVNAESATDADTLDGKDSGDFAAGATTEPCYVGSTGGNARKRHPLRGPQRKPTTFANEAYAATLAPVAMVATDLAFKVSQPPGVASTRTLTMRVNGVDTSLACTVTGINQSCSASGAIMINPMDSIALVQYAGGAPPAVVSRPVWLASGHALTRPRGGSRSRRAAGSERCGPKSGTSRIVRGQAYSLDYPWVVARNESGPRYNRHYHA